MQATDLRERFVSLRWKLLALALLPLLALGAAGVFSTLTQQAPEQRLRVVQAGV